MDLNPGTASEAERRITRFLEEQPEVSFAFLFGSRAGGRPRPDSDLDVAVYLDGGMDTGQRFQWRTRSVAALTPRDAVDLVVLNEAPPLLAHRALMGRALLIRDRTAFVRFFVKTLALSNDEAYWREMHARARRRRLEEGRFGRP